MGHETEFSKTSGLFHADYFIFLDPLLTSPFGIWKEVLAHLAQLYSVSCCPHTNLKFRLSGLCSPRVVGFASSKTAGCFDVASDYPCTAILSAASS